MTTNRENIIRQLNRSDDESFKLAIQLDYIIITLSTSLFAFSFSFLDRIIPFEKAIGFYHLYASWATLGILLAVVVVSYLLSLKALSIKRDWCISVLDKKEDEKERADGMYKYVEATNRLTIVECILFLGGIFFLGCFIFYNLEFLYR